MQKRHFIEIFIILALIGAISIVNHQIDIVRNSGDISSQSFPSSFVDDWKTRLLQWVWAPPQNQNLPRVIALAKKENNEWRIVDRYDPKYYDKLNHYINKMWPHLLKSGSNIVSLDARFPHLPLMLYNLTKSVNGDGDGEIHYFESDANASALIKASLSFNPMPKLFLYTKTATGRTSETFVTSNNEMFSYTESVILDEVLRNMHNLDLLYFGPAFTMEHLYYALIGSQNIIERSQGITIVIQEWTAFHLEKNARVYPFLKFWTDRKFNFYEALPEGLKKIPVEEVNRKKKILVISRQPLEHIKFT